MKNIKMRKTKPLFKIRKLPLKQFNAQLQADNNKLWDKVHEQEKELEKLKGRQGWYRREIEWYREVIMGLAKRGQ